MVPMFPTTIWTTIRQAGQDDSEALEQFAENYRRPVLQFIRKKGFLEQEAQDICQDVFLRLLNGRVLAKADGNRGRFRSLLLAVTSHVILDRLRKRKEPPLGDEICPVEEPEKNDEFDRTWVLYLAEQAMAELRTESAHYYRILADHLEGHKQDRNKLWIARSKLSALIRAAIAKTCSSHREFEEEVAYLSRYLRPGLQDDLTGHTN